MPTLLPPQPSPAPLHWKSRAATKRQEQYNSIPVSWRLMSPPTDSTLNALDYIRHCDLLTPAEHKITSITDGLVLQEKLLSGQLSSVDVVTAFCKRAAVAQQLTGCCTEMMFEKAIDRAKWLDRWMKEKGAPVGPLHGFPITFKDNFDVEGEDTTIGWIGKIGQPAKSNSNGVELMLRLGAIVYAKTNVPQSLMMSDSYNHVFKQSVNALNRALISGGSSGGAGAIVGTNASIVSVGTDIGGSIRIPAVLQGLYGMCPSIGRVSYDSSGKNQKYIVPGVAGPLACELSSIELFFQTLLDSEPWNIDPGLLPVPWRSQIAKAPERPLKLGFIFDDGIVKPQPPVQRAIREMADMMRKAGHEVIEWDASSHVEGYDIWLKSVLSDGGADCEALCKLADEPLVEGMLVGKSEDILSAAGRQELEDRQTAYKRTYLQRWHESGIDALVMPVLPWVGFPPKTWVKSHQCVSYTSQWNLLDYASLAIPATHVDAHLDQPDAAWTAYQPRNISDEFNHKQYDVELVKNMPVGLQVVGGRFGEEKAVAVAKVIEALRSRSSAP